MHDRLGLKLHRDAWPTARVLATHAVAPAGLAGALRDHGAPLLLEVDPSRRPALAELMAGPLRALAAPPSERVAT